MKITHVTLALLALFTANFVDAAADASAAAAGDQKSSKYQKQLNKAYAKAGVATSAAQNAAAATTKQSLCPLNIYDSINQTTIVLNALPTDSLEALMFKLRAQARIPRYGQIILKAAATTVDASRTGATQELALTQLVGKIPCAPGGSTRYLLLERGDSTAAAELSVQRIAAEKKRAAQKAANAAKVAAQLATLETTTPAQTQVTIVVTAAPFESASAGAPTTPAPASAAATAAISAPAKTTGSKDDSVGAEAPPLPRRTSAGRPALATYTGRGAKLASMLPKLPTK